MDAVQRANSGHPGAPMGMADIAQVLWGDFSSTTRQSAVGRTATGSCSPTATPPCSCIRSLYLTGYPLGIEEIKNFRQLGSRCAGHPEHEPQLGIETTTGPLGQGLANAVGMALAEKMLAAQFNRPGFNIVDHYTYVFAGDGCLMEGISHEACSLAGTLGLGKLIVCLRRQRHLHRRQGGGLVHGTTRPKRFEAYGWHVIPTSMDTIADAIAAAIERGAGGDATAVADLLQDHHRLGRASTSRARRRRTGRRWGRTRWPPPARRSDWPYEPFVDSRGDPRSSGTSAPAGPAAEAAWHDLFQRYRDAHPELAREFDRRMRGDLPQNWSETVATATAAMAAQTAPKATRQSSQAVLDVLAPGLPELLGGSADLTGSNNTLFKRRSHPHARGLLRQLHPLRRARIRDDRRDERHRPARRVHSLRRHVPRVLGLRAQRRPPGVPDGSARRYWCTRTIRSVWARTVRRTSRSST